MIEDVKRFGSKPELHSLCTKSERSLDKGRDIVDRVAPSGVATDYNAVDNRPIRGRPWVTAIRRAGDDVVRQAGRQNSYPADADPKRCCVRTAEYEALPLIENGAPVLHASGLPGIVGILARNIGIDIVDRM